jgi:hypothetical protein
MAEARATTGIAGLDADLGKLFELPKEKLDEIKAAIADHALTEDQLFDIVPKAIYRLTAGLLDPTTYQSLISSIPITARPGLEEARGIVTANFAGLLKHPALVRLIAKDTAGLPSFQQIANTITSVRHVPGWTGKPPKLSPMSRVQLLGVGNQLLLDSTCDWDDLLLVSKSFADTLRCEMKAGVELANLKQVELSKETKERIARFVRRLENNIKHIKQFGESYGIAFDSQSDDVADDHMHSD